MFQGYNPVFYIGRTAGTVGAISSTTTVSSTITASRSDAGAVSSSIAMGSQIIAHIGSLPTTNLFANFVAEQGITASAGLVTQWNDQSGGSWNAVTAPSSPIVAADYRGLPTVRFHFANTTGLSFAAAHTFDARNLAVFVAMRPFAGGGTFLGLLSYAGSAGHLRWSATPSTLHIVSADGTIKPRMNPSVMAAVTTATASAAYSNYQNVTGLVPVTSGTGTGATIGQFSTSDYTSADIYEIAIYEGAITGTQITNIISYLNSRYGIRTTDYTKNIVFEGDSITEGLGVVWGQSYPLQVLRAGIEDWRMTNLGISGSTIASMTARGTNTDTLFASGYTRNVLIAMIGRNDLASLTAQQMYDNFVTYVQARRAAGWEVWVGTEIATGNSGFQTTIDAYNAKLRGTDGPGIVAAAGASRIVDFAANSAFSTLAASSNLTYYQGDGTHPTAAGDTILAGIVANTLAASVVADISSVITMASVIAAAVSAGAITSVTTMSIAISALRTDTGAITSVTTMSSAISALRTDTGVITSAIFMIRVITATRTDTGLLTSVTTMSSAISASLASATTRGVMSGVVGVGSTMSGV